MFKLVHQISQQIKDNYIEYKKEKELKNIFKNLVKLDYYFINGKSFYEKNYNKQNTIYIKIENINKLSNNITKLFLYSIEYLNNLPLHLKWLSLSASKVNCNLPPNIIYLSCNYCDIYNLPKSLTFLVTYTNIHNEIILNNNNIKKYISKLLYDYFNIIFNNYNINFITWKKHFYHFLYILK